MTTKLSLEGWDMALAATAGEARPWVPWGEGGLAQAQVLSSADGYMVVLVEADAGYAGTPHEHGFAEFLYVLEGRLRNQGQVMVAGDAYAAAAGSTHDEFVAEEPSRYVSIFKV